MKRTLLFIASVLASVMMQAQEVPNDYIPFVELGKQWHVARLVSGHEDVDNVEYIIPFDAEKVNCDGKDFYKMKTFINHEESSTYLIREENRKVYLYDPDLKFSFLLFDYSLKEGDTYETYLYEYQRMVTYKVLSVEDGPKVGQYYYDETAGIWTVRYRHLRKWVVQSDIESILCLDPKTWIEGVGSLGLPLSNLYHGFYYFDHLAYVTDQKDTYMFFSFGDTLPRLWFGCNLPTGAEVPADDKYHHQLTYELEGNRLHVYGNVCTQVGPNNYAYFIEEPTDDSSVRKLHFKIQEVEPTKDRMALHSTDFYVGGLPPHLDYIIVDNYGEEHPVINKAPLNKYRPFVEEGKVWKVRGSGISPSGYPMESWIEYCYFDGDTIIGGQTCKQMKCITNNNPSPLYIGAWYEQDKKVYFAGNNIEREDMAVYFAGDRPQFELFYDFTLSSYDIMPNPDGHISVVYKWTGIYPGFKGSCYTFGQERWYEGVGSTSWPYVNHPYYYVGGASGVLLACSVGDEVIYYNSEEEDPYGMGAETRRFDFTHTIKIQPKAPKKKVAEKLLYGEYNAQQLDINLSSLEDEYMVHITDASGKVVYEKTINAGNIVGLNIDISAYTEGLYTVTMENSQESFTGEFNSNTTGIEEVRSKRLEPSNHYIYNLQGQRLSDKPAKGLYIQNGKKVAVK